MADAEHFRPLNRYNSAADCFISLKLVQSLVTWQPICKRSRSKVKVTAWS